jgi:hypothetical protein
VGEGAHGGVGQERVAGAGADTCVTAVGGVQVLATHELGGDAGGRRAQDVADDLGHVFGGLGGADKLVEAEELRLPRLGLLTVLDALIAPADFVHRWVAGSAFAGGFAHVMPLGGGVGLDVVETILVLLDAAKRVPGAAGDVGREHVGRADIAQDGFRIDGQFG